MALSSDQWAPEETEAPVAPGPGFFSELGRLGGGWAYGRCGGGWVDGEWIVAP